MATARLIPSAYTLSNTSYLSISDASNMYTNTDSDTYATVTHNRSQNSTYYLYISGFNFSAIDPSWTINSFTVKLKAQESGLSTSSSYRCSLYHSSTAISNTTLTSSLSTSATTYTFPTSSLDWETLEGYGSNFRIRVPLRRASSGTSGYVRVYGAEIEVDYTIPVSCTITSTLTGDGTISPSGAYSTYEDTEYTLTITPTDKSAVVTVTHDGLDVTSQLVSHGSGDTISAVPADVTTSSIQSGASYAEYAVGYSAESPSSSGTSSNMYAASGSTGYAEYTFDFSSIPSGATIESVEVRCYGHRENATIDSTHVSNVAIYVNNTSKVDEDFQSTSNSIVTLTPTLTRSELDNVSVRHTVGYYGGLVLGITFEVTYSTGSGLDHYTYTFTTTGDATIAVVIGGGGTTAQIWTRETSGWTAWSKVWAKTSSGWVQQSDLTGVFDSNTNYVRG